MNAQRGINSSMDTVDASKSVLRNVWGSLCGLKRQNTQARGTISCNVCF